MNQGRILFVLAALLWAGTAGAAQEGQRTSERNQKPKTGDGITGGILAADSTVKVLRTTNDGYLQVTETAPALSTANVFSQVITNGASTDTTAIGMADSSAIFDTRSVGRLFLGVKIAANGPSGAVQPVRIAFQVRRHLNGQADSISTQPWIPQVRGIQGVSATVDSATSMGLLTQGTSVAPSNTEFVVIFDGSAADGVATKWGHQRSFYIPLSLIFGQDYWCDFTSIRWRVLGGSVLTGFQVKTWISLTGTPL